MFGYLEEMNFATSGENKFIPENIFYKLCMKANNKIARKFQDLVCDEILPTIRKHGAYPTNEKIEEVLTNFVYSVIIPPIPFKGRYGIIILSHTEFLKKFQNFII